MASVATNQDTLQLVNNLKKHANDCFKRNRFHEAVKFYTMALSKAASSNADANTRAVLLGNRAFTRIKLEQYGFAIIDATSALSHDPNYIKAYYRRGTAYFALSRYKDARRDYAIIAQRIPDNKDTAAKLKECEKRIKEAAFAKAIQSDSLYVPVSNTIDVDSMLVPDSYTGPRLPPDGTVTESFVRDLMQCFRSQKSLHAKYAVMIVLAAKKIFDALPNVVELPVAAGNSITVCGDVHGQYYDLANGIFERNGLPSAKNPYLFNGDFVDRGSFSVEVILTLLAIKVWCPDAVHLTRGNHESLNMNRIYGFEGEVRVKYTETIFTLFSETFQSLPLAYILDGTSASDGRKAFVVHGGLFSKDGVTIADINALNRKCEPDSGLMAEMLWSDPQEENGWGPSKRGIGVAFGPDVTQRFLDLNGLDIVVRSHEMKDEGYEVSANGRLVTIFSAPNYCDQMGNKGAFIRFKPDMEPNFVQFTAVPHPHVPPMRYASKLLLGAQ
ncbi:Serine/threonine-protein phosphatase 5 [Gracilariopsis chorda]|uniref:protein-serine/threonine phosphatase n=1 Tax=Gracilariopsis chorda TaxID=448386 RepID=A0A2V3J061_9FLOR|nr:Serine/threonine-protein phosphatase 5 [Gracilariopsis chorda]|eukprot:PXF47317.1 Serine/threonine-protein phosphatase 5 [Gracilariopsis chorda]